MAFYIIIYKQNYSLQQNIYYLATITIAGRIKRPLRV